LFHSIGAHEFGDVPNRCGLGLDTADLGGQGGAPGFDGGQSTGRLVSLTGEARTGPALAFHGRQGGVGLAALGRFLDGRINLTEPPVEAGDVAVRNLDPRRKGRVLPLIVPACAAPMGEHTAAPAGGGTGPDVLRAAFRD
jgi:hypothetical protein